MQIDNKIIQKIGYVCIGLLVLFLLVYGCAAQKPEAREEKLDSARTEEARETARSELDIPASEFEQSKKEVEPVKVPDWYEQRSYSDERLIVTGYGRGNTMEMARGRALKDIAQHLGVRVKSLEEDLTESIKDQQEHIREEYRREIRLEADQQIKDWRVVERERSGSDFFIKIELDRRPAHRVIADKISRRWTTLPAEIEWLGAEPLIQGSLIHNIENEITDPTGQKEKQIGVKLQRLHEEWYLEVTPGGESSFSIPLDEKDFVRLFSWPELTEKQQSVNLQLKTLSDDRGYNRLRAGDFFAFKVEATEEGFATLFNIYQDGRVSVLEDNIEISSSIEIPGPEAQERGEMFGAYLIEKGKPTRDLYMAVLSKRPLLTSNFQKILEANPPVRGEESYQIHRLLNWLKSNEEEIVDLDVISVLVQP